MRPVYSIVLLTAALSLVSAVSHAQQSQFRDYDTNRDNKISQQEFQNQIRNNQSFQNIDRNEDRRIDQDEFDEAGIGGDYGLWDTNDDSFVDEDEYYGGAFVQYDADNDGYWDNDDWSDAEAADWFEV